MGSLKLYGSKIDSFYELLGSKENDMTYGLGYALSKSNNFLDLLLKHLGVSIQSNQYNIELQKFEGKGKGFTDIEISTLSGELILIIEAKKGWNLPDREQLIKYELRELSPKGKISVLSDSSAEYASYKLEPKYPHISWKQVIGLINQAVNKTSSTIEKNHLWEFSNYLSKLTIMKREESNWVFCVALGYDKVGKSELSFVDVVRRHNSYFYPYGKNWPLEAPNYIAFRYDAKLQSIHKVESFEVTELIADKFSELSDDDVSGPHFILKLGPAITPPLEVKNGGLYASGRYWCMFDTLLIGKTLKEAVAISKTREQDWI